MAAQRREPHLSHDDYQRPRCSICRLGREGTVDLPRIEKLLADGARLKPVAERFQINWCSLRRHWLEVSAERKNYLKFGSRLSREALAAAADEEKLGSVDHLRLIRAGLHRTFQKAVQIGDFHAVANLARALDDNVERSCRLSGEWRDEPTSITNVAVINLPGVANVIGGIARTLAGFPDARQKVIEYLRTANGATVALPAPETIDAAAE
jgi:hypothetical protein